MKNRAVEKLKLGPNSLDAPLFMINLEMHDKTNKQILFYSDDVCEDVALMFCKQNKLDLNYYHFIVDCLQDKLDKTLKTQDIQIEIPKPMLSDSLRNSVRQEISEGMNRQAKGNKDEAKLVKKPEDDPNRKDGGFREKYKRADKTADDRLAVKNKRPIEKRAVTRNPAYASVSPGRQNVFDRLYSTHTRQDSKSVSKKQREDTSKQFRTLGREQKVIRPHSQEMKVPVTNKSNYAKFAEEQEELDESYDFDMETPDKMREDTRILHNLRFNQQVFATDPQELFSSLNNEEEVNGVDKGYQYHSGNSKYISDTTPGSQYQSNQQHRSKYDSGQQKTEYNSNNLRNLVKGGDRGKRGERYEKPFSKSIDNRFIETFETDKLLKTYNSSKAYESHNKSSEKYQSRNAPSQSRSQEGKVPRYEQLHFLSKVQEERRSQYRDRIDMACTFKPKLNCSSSAEKWRSSEKVRPGFKERMIEDLEKRMQKQEEAKVSMSRELLRRTMTPQTGRMPLRKKVVSLLKQGENRTQVHEELYKLGQEGNAIKANIRQLQEKHYVDLHNESKMTMESRFIMDRIFEEKIEQLFSELDSDRDGLISSVRVNIDVLTNDRLLILSPLLAEMEEKRVTLDFSSFSKSVRLLLEVPRVSSDAEHPGAEGPLEHLDGKEALGLEGGAVPAAHFGQIAQDRGADPQEDEGRERWWPGARAAQTGRDG
jgi:hypothetical protein